MTFQKQATIVLATSVEESRGKRDVLVNLGNVVPEGFEAFNRVIEVVSTDGADRDLARGRWKLYAGRSYSISRHDLALKRTE